ncbi:MAG: (2Fe-2S)-binding protein [Alphaproteobacteria bacterium]|nr:(2Fe-2S)-binding protein [Alphaproteobacteria bacterium]MBU0803918.1 (2Fe-2S)-binding protein [Alphaproteobacteria bacterium]MBU0872785.1 (2Fe-2S)-binding protein [Alphaproteobacteria bacterium]MBU1402845.1 (2Fe-2S)-binding protein [Alphaproteobacteria bacterium]MBU1593487.1 (2Fe-2S)-binding protein [Alphaproteobacteria bacterium]
MTESVILFVDGEQVRTARGTTLASLLHARNAALRTSPAGRPRGLYCGMGVCFECMVRVDGETVRSCVTQVRDDMRVEVGQ